MFLERVIHFGETLGDHLKGRSPKNLKSLTEDPNVIHVKVHVISFNMILISSQKDVFTPSYPFWEKLGNKEEGSPSEKNKNFNRGSISTPSESACF